MSKPMNNQARCEDVQAIGTIGGYSSGARGERNGKTPSHTPFAAARPPLAHWPRRGRSKVAGGYEPGRQRVAFPTMPATLGADAIGGKLRWIVATVMARQEDTLWSGEAGRNAELENLLGLARALPRYVQVHLSRHAPAPTQPTARLHIAPPFLQLTRPKLFGSSIPLFGEPASLPIGYSKSPTSMGLHSLPGSDTWLGRGKGRAKAWRAGRNLYNVCTCPALPNGAGSAREMPEGANPP